MNDADKKLLCGFLSVLLIIPLAFRHQLLPFFFHESAVKTFEFRQPPPTISGLQYQAAPTTGGTSLLIEGTNFGETDAAISVSIGINYCTDVMRVSATELTCLIPPGLGQNLAVIVTVKGIPCESPALFSYDRPVILHLSKMSGPTAGRDVITAQGSNFGNVNSGIEADFGHYRSPRTKWLSPNAVEITVPKGVGVHLPVSLNVGGQQSRGEMFFDYFAPTVESIRPQTGPTTGGAIISIVGDNFGPRFAFPTAFVGGQQCIFTTWRSNGLVECALPEGTGVQKSVEVSVGGQTSSSNTLFSYDAPSVSAIHPESGPTSGGTVVTVMGANFGPIGTSPLVRFNHKDCQTAYLSDTEVTCVTPPGSGTDVSIQVVVDGQESMDEPFFSYGEPTIMKLTPNSGPTAGNTVVTIGGSNFGHSAESLQSIKVDGKECLSRQYVASTELLCTTPPGNGQGLSVEITIDGVVSKPNSLWSYSTPVVTDVTPNHGATAGGTLVTVSGENFGLTSPSRLKVFIEDQACISVGWISATKVTCATPPGVGSQLDVTVTVNGQDSTGGDKLWSYDAPLITSVEPKHGPTVGGTVVTIVAENLGDGVDDRQISATIGGEHCRITKKALTQHFVICESPEGVGSGKPVIVSVNGLASPPAPMTWSYDRPIVNDIEPLSGNGDMPITIYGRNFGTTDTAPLAKIGDIECRTCQWITDRRMTCIIPQYPNPTGPLPVTVTAGGQTSEVTDTSPKFTYGDIRPLVSGIDPDHGPTLGGTEIVISGSRLSGETVEISVGGSPVTITKKDDSSISFLTGPGVGVKSVLVSVNGKAAMGTLQFRYDPPVITSATVSNQDTDWDSLTLIGENFGSSDQAVNIYLVDSSDNKEVCASVQHESDKVVSCKPRAPSAGKKVHVTVGGAESNNFTLQ